MAQEKDWVMQMTEDQHWRAITIWQDGLLDRLPEEIDHAIMACTLDGEGYALLMRNVTHALLPDESSFSEADNEFTLDAMTALHATFWDDVALHNPGLNLCSPENLFTHTAPEKTRQLATDNPSPVLEAILEGWRILTTFVDADVVDLLRDLARDPRPLCSALSSYPQTLVHGDWRLANFGVERGERPQLILLDWSRPTRTVPAVDLAYYLVSSWSQLPISKEATIELYKQRLAQRIGERFDESWWQPQLELSLLSAFLMLGCFKARDAAHLDNGNHQMQEQADFEWWSEQVRAGAEWLTW
jgi:hypothetical protein